MCLPYDRVSQEETFFWSSLETRPQKWLNVIDIDRLRAHFTSFIAFFFFRGGRRRCKKRGGWRGAAGESVVDAVMKASISEYWRSLESMMVRISRAGLVGRTAFLFVCFFAVNQMRFHMINR